MVSHFCRLQFKINDNKIYPLKQDTVCNYPDLRPMEMFDCLNEGNGQSYGYAVYRKELTGLKTGDKLKIKGRIHDLLIVMINGVMVTKTPIVSILDTLVFGSWGLRYRNNNDEKLFQQEEN